ncbi:ABC transporter ATP-binding protein [Acrocarpospora pleiomorpha]|nr:ABC transporter ATP-binding protein [Acrocarpospora pleiomorpha]
MLSVEGVSLRFGGVLALDDVTFSVDDGSICGLIGPNGAGKTTLFNCITRLYDPDSGHIHFNGLDLLDRRAHEIPRHGVARTFQNLGFLPGETVLDNVLLGAHHRFRSRYLGALLRSVAHRREQRALTEDALTVLAGLNLLDLAYRPVGGLPYGTQKRVELARAVVGKPRLILLDEPANGLTHGEVDELGDVIRRFQAERDLTVVLVEHHMRLVMGVSDHIVALAMGRKIFDGTPAAAQSNAALSEAYFGTTA